MENLCVKTIHELASPPHRKETLYVNFRYMFPLAKCSSAGSAQATIPQIHSIILSRETTSRLCNKM